MLTSTQHQEDPDVITGLTRENFTYGNGLPNMIMYSKDTNDFITKQHFRLNIFTLYQQTFHTNTYIKKKKARKVERNRLWCPCARYFSWHTALLTERVREEEEDFNLIPILALIVFCHYLDFFLSCIIYYHHQWLFLFFCLYNI